MKSTAVFVWLNYAPLIQVIVKYSFSCQTGNPRNWGQLLHRVDSGTHSARSSVAQDLQRVVGRQQDAQQGDPSSWRSHRTGVRVGGPLAESRPGSRTRYIGKLGVEQNLWEKSKWLSQMQLFVTLNALKWGYLGRTLLGKINVKKWLFKIFLVTFGHHSSPGSDCSHRRLNNFVGSELMSLPVPLFVQKTRK